MIFKLTLIHLFTNKWFIVQQIVHDVTYKMFGVTFINQLMHSAITIADVKIYVI
jgi:hypothetical protein